MRVLVVATALSGLSLVLTGCSDDNPLITEDMGVDVGTEDQGMDLGPFSGTAPDGPWLPTGGDGVADPLAGGGARAGRAAEGMLPDFDSDLQVWETGDFILANERVALVIEDVGPSDLYDPWGGRPVGIGSVEGGQLVRPGDFGEFFMLFGRMTPVTEFVGVINDGTDGNPAIVRAQGRPEGLPFLEVLLQFAQPGNYRNVPTIIDYELAADTDYVDVYVTHQNYNTFGLQAGGLRGFMYTGRMPSFTVGEGFGQDRNTDIIAFIDHDATSWGYSVPGQRMSFFLSQSGFKGLTAPEVYSLPGNSETRVHYARLHIGGVGLNGFTQAVARTQGVTQRAITGSVFESDATTPAEGVTVHAEVVPTTGDPVYTTRVDTAADGTYTLHVPAEADVQLTTSRKGDTVVGPVAVPAATSTQDFTLTPTGLVRVTVTDADSTEALPCRVQLMPVGGGPAIPSLPGRFGLAPETSGRLHSAFATGGDGGVSEIGIIELRAPVGDWRLVVSRGTEYSMFDQTVTVTDGDAGVVTNEVAVTLTHEVDTVGQMCTDFHVHTARSNDSSDPVRLKIQQAIADGLDIPARSEHEFVEPIDPLVVDMGLGDWAFGHSSLELTTFEFYGHFGAVGIDPGDGYNGGTPQWITFPTAANRNVGIEFIQAPELFATTRARPEAPRIIINHPRGGNYFDYVGLDPVTGLVDSPEFWDTEFQMIEVFNSSGWQSNRDGTIADWFAILNTGRKMFAVGSSDSHSLTGSPVGYARTCMELGTDDPRAISDAMIRDAAYNGQSNMVGGVYVDASIGGVGHGGSVTGAAATTMMDLLVQAPTWIGEGSDPQYRMEIIVDGVTTETINLPNTPPVLYDSASDGQINVPVSSDAQGSWVVVAVYSGNDTNLDPVNRGRAVFGASNPIFLTQ